jgi:putative FmdB family regulatory protein
MPIYEYECQSCGQRFDVMQKFTDDQLTACKFCKGAVRKLMGTPALQFKGTGWYVTDYAGKSPKPGDANKPASCTATEAAPKSADGAAAPACACASGNCDKK